MSTLRNEMKKYIDTINDSRLKALKPLLKSMAEEEFIIETDLTNEEKQIIAEGEKLFKEQPERFSPFKFND